MKLNSILLLIAVAGAGLNAGATSISVATADPAPAVDGLCSIIEAIDNANDDAATHADCAAGSGADTVVLAASTTYSLDQVDNTDLGPNGLPVVSSQITIEGNGSTIERADGSPQFRLLAVDAAGDLEVHDLTLRDGDLGGAYHGGGLLNQAGQVQLTRVTVTGSAAARGGGLYNGSGLMTLSDSVVSLNVATQGGGGIFSSGESGTAALVVERTAVTGNSVIDGGGGGVYSLAVVSWQTILQITGSAINNNTAARTTGGIRSLGSQVQIDDSTIDGNHAGWACGGVYLERGAGAISRSTVSHNIVDNTIDFGTGGGLCVADNTTTITNSTISGNQVLGPASAGSLSGRGGGISVIGDTVDTMVVVEASTICDNTAETLGGGISVYRNAGTMAVGLELHNTVVAQNLEQAGALPGNCIEEFPATVSSLDFNLADDVTCNLVGTDDLVVADVMLSPLADNGGPTLTHMPADSSPAVDSGDDALCPELDQRGNIRPWDGDDDGQANCDRGAVELGAPFFFDGFESGDTTMWSLAVP